MKFKNKIIFLMVILLLMSSVSFAERDYVDLINDLESNNVSLGKLDINMKELEVSAYITDYQSKTMSNLLDELNKYGVELSPLESSEIMYAKDMAPKVIELEQAKLKLQRALTRRELELTSRTSASVIMASLDAYNLYIEKEKHYELLLKDAKLQYELGQITKSDLLAVEVNYLEIKSNLDISSRQLEDSYLAMNQLLGNDLKETYLIKKEDQYSVKMKDVSFYVETALAQRLDLLMIKKDIDLNKELITFYNYGHYLNYVVNQNTYDSLLLKAGNLNMSQLIKRDEIEKQIYEGYLVLDLKSKEVDKLKINLQIQENEYKNHKEKMKNGKLSYRSLEALAFNLTQIRNNLSLAIYDFNTSHLSFIHLTYYGSINGGGMR